MTEEWKRKIGRPSPRNKGGSVTRGSKGKPYIQVWVRVADRHIHPTVNKKGTIRRSHLVWNQAHPEDPVLPGQVIHHIDGDSLNDTPANLEKLPGQRVHAKHHFSQPRKPLSDAHKAAISATKRRQVEDRPCAACGGPVPRATLLRCGRFCSQTCHYAFRTGKGRAGW
jgi:hypothetical protein